MENIFKELKDELGKDNIDKVLSQLMTLTENNEELNQFTNYVILIKAQYSMLKKDQISGIIDSNDALFRTLRWSIIKLIDFIQDESKSEEKDDFIIGNNLNVVDKSIVESVNEFISLGRAIIFETELFLSNFHEEYDCKKILSYCRKFENCLLSQRVYLVPILPITRSYGIRHFSRTLHDIIFAESPDFFSTEFLVGLKHALGEFKSDLNEVELKSNILLSKLSKVFNL